MKVALKRFKWYECLVCIFFVLGTLLLCICIGSVTISVKEVLRALGKGVLGLPSVTEGFAEKIVLSVRLPRVLCVAAVGAALSLCGVAMQGLLRNPLADGSTLGVSSGASLGAVLAIALGIFIPQLPFAGTMVMAMLFAFASVMLITLMAFALDRSMKTYTIILIGVVFTMFTSSLINLVIAFSGEKVRTITFWTMGSLASSSMPNALTLWIMLPVCGGVLLRYAPELNAFAMGEEDAMAIGVSVKRVKLVILMTVSVMIGVCCSIGGNIGFVGLIVPHAMRMIVGSNHRRLMPASLFAGAIFLLLADLLARTVVSPVELPIGVVTSLIGAVAFVWIFYHFRKARERA